MNRKLCSLAFLLGLSGCKFGNYTHLYQTEPIAPSLTEAEITSHQYMGPTIIDNGVNFAVYSQHATKIDLLVFDDPESSFPSQTFPMTQFGDTWNVYVAGVGVGLYYGYVAWGPNWPYDPSWYPGSIAGFIADVDADGNRFNPNKLLNDPYAKGMHRDFNWSEASAASGPARTSLTWGAAGKSVVVKSQYQWSANEEVWRTNRQLDNNPGHNWNEDIIYEVSPKGFTMESASGVQHPGTFKGVGEKASYLADLGVTAVELMPVMQKPVDGGYWGYWTINFFEPNLDWTVSLDPLQGIDEFKGMVDALHQANIEVILDVVYNHTGEGGLWETRQYTSDVDLDPTLDGYVNEQPTELATIYSERGLDNASYYALSTDNQSYWDNTGVGQETRPNFVPMHQMIMDSLHFWAGEMHADGFRFDLAGILGEQDQNYNQWMNPSASILQTIADDPLLQQYNTRLIAEPWTAGGNYGDLVGAYPASTNKPGTGWGEWNGNFRDLWRDINNNDSWALNGVEGKVDIGGSLTGSAANYQYNKRAPYNSINYVVCHDGFTMYDAFAYNSQNNGCGPLNPVCCTNPTSPFCTADDGTQDNRSRDWGPIGDAPSESTRRQLIRNMFTAMMVAQGTPMMYGGDEWLRTQYGNNNAYSDGADNQWNWLNWGEWQPNQPANRMHDFVRQLIGFRKANEWAFAPMTYSESGAGAWLNPSGAPMAAADWAGRSLMQYYTAPPAGSKQIAILINMSRNAVEYTLPTGVTWERVLDTQAYFDDPANIAAASENPMNSQNVFFGTPVTITTPNYNVMGTSIVILTSP